MQQNNDFYVEIYISVYKPLDVNTNTFSWNIVMLIIKMANKMHAICPNDKGF